MHIGYLYDFVAYPPKGGNHLHAYEITKGFLEAGHQVSVVGDPSMPGATNYAENIGNLRAFINVIDILYVRVDARFITKWPIYKQCHKLAASLPIVWEINSSADEKLAYSWLGGKDLAQAGNENIFRRLKRWAHATRAKPGIIAEERYRRSFTNSVSAAICVSESMGRYARESLGIGEVLVLPNAGPLVSEAEIFERRSRRVCKDFTVLYSGSVIYPWQGIPYLLAVIDLAEKFAPEIKFILAVNQKTPELPHSKNITVLEGLSQEEVRDQMCMADACVALPPEWPWAKYGFHGSPMKLFDYMACMAPVVTSNHSQMKEILNDGKDALLCENNPKDILDKIIFLKNNPSDRSAIGRGAWERVQSELNWKSNSEKTLLLFKKLLFPN